jgi:hypothetical protein
MNTGRYALFGAPATPVKTGDGGHGRHALFSAPPRRKWTVVVECSRCQARTPVPLVELGPRLLPSVWLPGRPFSRLLRCPAGGHLSWCRIHWSTALT